MRTLMMLPVAALTVVGLASQVSATPIPPFEQRNVLVQHSSGSGNTSTGFYNSSLGQILNGTDPFFPCDFRTCGDPTRTLNAAPPISAAAQTILGNWLTDPAHLNANWSLQSIPTTWRINDETAIVYSFSIEAAHWTNVELKATVDNGIVIWLDGAFIFGAQAPGGTSEWEYDVKLADLGSGQHFLQILREDHGGSDGFGIELRGTPVADVPEPASLALLGIGLLGLGLARRRDRN